MKLVLIATDSKTLLDKKIASIMKESTNKIIYSFPENTLVDILEEASYVSFFQEEKFLIVKNADFFGKEKLSEKDTNLLMEYFEHPYPYTTLIFTTYESVDHRKNITKKLEEKGEFYLLQAPKNYELFQEIKKEMSHYKIDDREVRYIIDACLGNYDMIEKEKEKLKLIYQSNDTIKKEELKQIIVPNANENQFKFVDAVIKKDAYQVFHLLEDFESLKTDPYQLMNLLAREYRLIYLFKILEKKNISSKEMAQSLKLQDWQLDKLRKESSFYHEDDLKDYLVSLSKIDSETKSGQKEKTIALINFLIQVLEYS